MLYLEPRVAAEMADDVYLVQNQGLVSAFLTRPEFKSNPSVHKQLTAEVGHPFFRAAKDAFGLCAIGEGSYKKHMFIIFRGSTTANNKADWVSNFRVGVTPARTGLPVHKGFRKILDSMLPDIQQYLIQNANKVDVIHCIGHSLGGAVATLMADWVKSSYREKVVKLYTFGAPKAGLMMFNTNLTKKMGMDNIYRVFHATDPVPMIPLFPYVHAPFPGFGHYIYSNQNIASADAHDRKKYISSVKKLTWNQFERRMPAFYVDSAIEDFLKSKLKVNPNSPKIWEWLNAALIYVLKKVIGVVVKGIFYTAMTGFTLVDTIAYMLMKGIDLIKGVSQWVVWLMQKIMQVLGRKVPKSKDELSREIIRESLTRVMEKVEEEARKAVQKIK